MFLVKSRFEQERIVSPLLKSHRDLPRTDVNGRVRVDEISKERPRLGAFIALAQFIAQ